MQTENFHTFNNRLGQQLQTLRKAHGLSQEAVGELLDMDRVSIGYIEQGKRAPRLQTIYALSRLYGVSVRDIFDFDMKSRS